MKRRADDYVPYGGVDWKGGSKTFMYKGTNRRWEGLISTDELALYDAACDRALTDDCRRWLETGD